MKMALRFSLLAIVAVVSGCSPHPNLPPLASMNSVSYIFPPTNDQIAVGSSTAANNSPNMSPASLAQLAPAAGAGDTANVYANMPPEVLAQLSPAAGGSGTAKATPIVKHETDPGATQLRVRDNGEAISTNNYHSLGLMRTILSDY